VREHFKPSQQLTFATVHQDSERLKAVFQNDAIRVLQLDLGEVTYCDSAGLALLIEAKRLCTHHRKTLQLNGLSDSIRALAQFCGVESLLIQECEHEYA
jgi:phospholipid transport system transporter-binding protein